MHGRSPFFISRSIILLTFLCSCTVLALPQGVNPEFYTLLNGQESFLPTVLENNPTALNNEGGPAVVQVSTIQATATIPCPNPTPAAIPTVTVVASASTATTGAGEGGIFVQVSVTASTAPTKRTTLLTLTTLQAGAISQVEAIPQVITTLQAITTLPAGAVPPVDTIIQAITTLQAVTTLQAGTEIIVPIATATHTAVAEGPTNLSCSGDANVLTAFEQANNNRGNPLTFIVTNKCPYSIWPEVSYREWPNSGAVTFFDFGELASNSAPYSWTAHPYWMTSARLWAKEGCNGNGENCIVDAGNAPTLFEFNIYPDQNSCDTEIDYDVSLVDGHTIPISVTFDTSDCPSRTCSASKNLNGVCPSADLNTINGVVQGCLSSCSYLQSMGVNTGDAFELACCAGAHNTPETCSPTSPWFSQVCPEAYSYAYDDVAANRACALPGVVTIDYCPGGAMP